MPSIINPECNNGLPTAYSFWTRGLTVVINKLLTILVPAGFVPNADS